MLADPCDPSIPVESNSAHYVSPRTFWTEHKKPGLCKTWCNSNNTANAPKQSYFNSTHGQSVSKGFQMLVSLKSHFSHLSWRYNTHSQKANRLGQMSSPFEMELSSWSHGNCDINTWLSQESCHLMRTWSHSRLLPPMIAVGCCCGAVALLRTRHWSIHRHRCGRAKWSTFMFTRIPPITTFYDKTPEFCKLTAIRSLYNTFFPTPSHLFSPKIRLILTGNDPGPACWWRLVTWRAADQSPWRLKWKRMRICVTTCEYKNNCNVCSQGDMTTQSCLHFVSNKRRLFDIIVEQF